ncbi:MAG: zinc-dependent metalloprotease, partial [Pirellulaceae bacterium]|nr:zinc-dependent metalloprotease [Pirellulaceae bacterium]
IEVRQQPDDADWDPEDINYNTFRWITSNAGFAMGPSRVNPYTGQILDADIIFDADFLTFWKQELETLTPDSLAATAGVRLDRDLSEIDHASTREMLGLRDPNRQCCLGYGMATQLAFGATALMAEGDPADPAKAQARERELIMQGLKQVAMHEVGHTLGLRHNFKGSTYRSLKDINDPAKTREGGMVSSIMDYTPTNIVPKGTPQGDFYPTTIGPYDLWAIEYGYKQASGSEDEELKKIASRSGEPALKYATDEDTMGILDSDPDSNRFDLGDDALEYARQRAELIEYGQAMQFAARYVGGIHTSRSHKGDKDGKPPFTVVDVKKQRDALTLLEQQVLSDKPFDFPPQLYNQLAASNWMHWGADMPLRKDLAVHDVILMWQEEILGLLTASITLERIHDAELKIPADQDVLTTAELLDRVTNAVFAEVKATNDGNYTERKPAISSLRRNLQRSYLQTLSNLAMGRAGGPEDCKTIAYAKLGALRDDIEKLLASKVKLDAYSSAHLRESSARIQKVLEAKLSLSGP